MSALAIPCPGPVEPLSVCVLKGFGSQLVQIKYFQDTQIDFTQVTSPGPWEVKVTVYKTDGTELLNFTSPTRVTLAASGYNVQFQFLDSEFDAVSAALGEYSYDVVATPTVGAKELLLYGPLKYALHPGGC